MNYSSEEPKMSFLIFRLKWNSKQSCRFCIVNLFRKFFECIPIYETFQQIGSRERCSLKLFWEISKLVVLKKWDTLDLPEENKTQKEYEIYFFVPFEDIQLYKILLFEWICFKMIYYSIKSFIGYMLTDCCYNNCFNVIV